MNKIKKIEPLVKNILEMDPDAREDDFRLVAQVYYKINNEIGQLPFNIVMLGHKDLKIPAIETITRARRKLQEKYEHLRPRKEIREIRMEQEEQIRRYAKEI